MLINKKTAIIYMESLVQFQESALTKLSICSGINTQPPNLVKCINEVWLNFQHQWIWIKEKSNQLKEWVLEITQWQYFWTHNTVQNPGKQTDVHFHFPSFF